MPPKGRPRKAQMNAEDGSTNIGDAGQDHQNSSFSLVPPSESTSMEIHAGPGNVHVMAEMSSPSGAPMSTMSSPPGTDESHKHAKHHAHHAHSHDDPQPHGYGLRHHHGYNLRDK